VGGPDRARGVYGISVAAELVGMGVQNLRAYEARGLLDPERTEGGTRRYSADDLDRLRRIGHLLDAGLNLAGIAMVMELQDENTRLRAKRRGPARRRTGRRSGRALTGNPRSTRRRAVRRTVTVRDAWARSISQTSASSSSSLA
jgi:DNA-binding transcriptional MerR regulator